MANTHNETGHSKSGQHSKTSEEGHKGVSQGASGSSGGSQVGSGKEHDPNNFANNPERAAAAGQKGGKHSHDRDAG